MMKKQTVNHLPRLAILLLLLLSAGTKVMAEDGVILTLKDGREIAFAFSSKPKISMGTELTITAQDGMQVCYDYADVHKVQFGETGTSGIGSTPAIQGPDLSFTISNGILSVHGLPAGGSVSIYDLGGRRVAMGEQASEAGTLNIALSAKGVLIVRTSTGIGYRIMNN